MGNTSAKPALPLLLGRQPCATAKTHIAMRNILLLNRYSLSFRFTPYPAYRRDAEYRSSLAEAVALLRESWFWSDYLGTAMDRPFGASKPVPFFNVETSIHRNKAGDLVGRVKWFGPRADHTTLREHLDFILGDTMTQHAFDLPNFFAGLELLTLFNRGIVTKGTQLMPFFTPSDYAANDPLYLEL